MMRRRGGAPRRRRRCTSWRPACATASRCSRSAAIRAPASAMRNISPRDDLAEAAADFFAMLSEFDVLGASRVVAMPVPDRGTGLAIDGRLRWATARP